jgi:hypothetical protein
MDANETTYGLTLENAAVTVTGLLVLVVTWWSWRGASTPARWWTGTPGTEWLVRMAMPGWGAAVFCFGAGLLAGEAVFGWFAVPGLLGLLLSLLGGLGLVPRWWGPRWYREEVGRRRGARG